MSQKQVGVLAAIWRHPVKSMLGEQLAQVEITERGAVGDRAWALRETATRRIASAKKFARLFDFRAKYDDPLEAGNGSPITIRMPDGSTIHPGDPEAAEQISAALGRKVTLERAETAVRERAGIDPKTVFADVPVEQVIPGLSAENLPPEFSLSPGSFFDTAVMHVIATGTLRHLAKLAGMKSIFDPRRFRPTLFVDSGPGDDRFVEDEWVGGELLVGASVKVTEMVPALRCVMTTHPQDDLPRDLDVLRTSARHHRNNVGVFAAIGAGDTVRIGDPVYLVK
ncbi:MAG: MOSC N-terminal beta barrel domain-containing protein [Candidatus Binataceae bacterium]